MIVNVFNLIVHSTLRRRITETIIIHMHHALVPHIVHVRIEKWYIIFYRPVVVFINEFKAPA